MSPQPHVMGVADHPVEVCDRCGIVPAEEYLEWSPVNVGIIVDCLLCYYCTGLFLQREVEGLIVILRRERAFDY